MNQELQEAIKAAQEDLRAIEEEMKVSFPFAYICVACGKEHRFFCPNEKALREGIICNERCRKKLLKIPRHKWHKKVFKDEEYALHKKFMGREGQEEEREGDSPIL